MKYDKTYNTILVIVVGLTVVSRLIDNQLLLDSVTLLGLLSIFSVKFSQIIIKFWTLLSVILSYIVPNIVMTVFYYLFLTPLSIFSKLITKDDPLHLKNNLNSTFKVVEKTFLKKSFFKMW